MTTNFSFNFKYIIYIHLILIICIYIIIIRINKKETFVTWYKPFYDKNNNNLLRNNIKSRYKCKNHYIKHPILFGIYNYKLKNTYSNSLIILIKKLLLKKSNILNIKDKIYNSDNELYHQLGNNNIDLALISTPIIYYNLYKNTNKYKPFYNKNINFIASINNLYIYIFITQLSNINSLYDLKYKRIGIDQKYSVSWACAMNILSTLNVQQNYSIIYNNLKQNLKLLYNDEIDCIFYIDVYPSNTVTTIFNNDILNILRIMPLNELDNTDFVSKYMYYSPGYINLNTLSNKYTPNLIGKYKYTTFRPMLKTYIFSNYLLGGFRINNNIGLSIINTIYNNINNINKLQLFKYNKFDKYNLVENHLLIPLNKGIINFYYKKGYITDINNPNCKYLVGNKECNKYNIDMINKIIT